MSNDLTLVTGGTGFVGSAVVRALLARDVPVRALARADSDLRNLDGLPVELVTGDLRQPDSLAAAVAGCRTLFHVAADYRIWVPDPHRMMQANVAGTEALMLAALDAGVERVVYCSSVAALGLTADGSPADEGTPVEEERIVGAYKKSKYRAEQAVLALVRERGLPAVSGNPSSPGGPRDIKPTPTGQMIADAASGRMPAYLDTGLNLVHVDDVAHGHLLALDRGRVGERYILGSENLTLAHILALVDDVTGRKRSRRRLPWQAVWPLALASEALEFVGAIEPRVTRDHVRMARKTMFFTDAKARAELGYAPRPPRAAIADALAWFRANGTLPA